ncbi:hypothetical protein DOTSEDRAFT_69570 [Dothistroma septosporum NZE10]|uniref:Uncharacterized protein n=1 Tax=Dothistroma septosporum (strain NZE10 / CBS 128990) TaxID=675120 RepID=N1PWA0_DOTSN|nr:hypothetical protein DOTSEDRAFT_69570 [Dothistroma septosporum NZE10]
MLERLRDLRTLRKCFEEHRSQHPVDHGFESPLNILQEGRNQGPTSLLDPIVMEYDSELICEAVETVNKRYCKCNTASTQFLLRRGSAAGINSTRNDTTLIV